MTVLVTGGQGFIGSHTCKALADSGYEIVSVDFCKGNRGPFPVQSYSKNYFFDLKEKDRLLKVMLRHNVTSVIHFAANAIVSESMDKPALYYQNNVTGTSILLDMMIRANISNIVFSSSCSVYGNPETCPVDENTCCNPVSVYGRTKLICEELLSDYCKPYNVNSISLRYFNVAGCDPNGELGERHIPETHLIPLVLKSVLDNTEINLFGDDYETPDGSCIRDYIHVSDLAAAHIKALVDLENSKNAARCRTYCVGNGNGISVLDVIKLAQEVTGKEIKIKVQNRRPGDARAIWTSNDKIKSELFWYPKYNTKDMIEHAWNWMKK